MTENDYQKPKLKLKDKKFADLKTWQKGIFFLSLFTMIATLIYTGTHLDEFSARYDTVDEFMGCTYTFKNGVLHKLTCPPGLEEVITNNTIYTISDYYEAKNKQIQTEPVFDINTI